MVVWTILVQHTFRQCRGHTPMVRIQRKKFTRTSPKSWEDKFLSDRPKMGRINGGGFLKNSAMATVLFIPQFKSIFEHFPILGACASNEMEYIGATPTAQNAVIEKFPKLCTASSCGLSPKSCNQVEAQLCSHWQTQMGKCIGQSHTPW